MALATIISMWGFGGVNLPKTINQLVVQLSQIWVDKMLVCNAKLQGTQDQYQQLDQALRTGLFVRNKALRYWMDGQGKRTADLNKYCRVLAKEYP
ncbi:hypothetical protein [Parathermosynechococcus lividus]